MANANLGNYVFNLETEKIELHFAKADYLALSDEQKGKIKSNFLWSNKGGCWVSRCKEPNLYHTRRVAESLGFAGEARVGERLSYGEKLEVQKERAEARAERYEEYAGNAEKRGAALCKSLDSHRGGIAFFTQPIIAGHSGSQSFARARERIYAAYHKGCGEYSKSEYYQGRTVVALETAAMSKLNDKGYLMRQIKDCIKEIKAREGHIIRYEESLYRIEQGETLKRYDQSVITEQDLQNAIERELELVNKVMDKQAFMEDKLAELGGVAFSKENIKVGYILQIGRFAGEVVSTGPQNIQYKSSCGLVLTAAYAEITKVLKETEIVKPPHPFEVGDAFDISRHDLCKKFSDPSPVHTYKIIKKTDVSVTIQNQTMPGEKNQNLRPSQSKFTPGAWDLTIRGKWFQKSSKKEVI